MDIFFLRSDPSTFSYATHLLSIYYLYAIQIPVYMLICPHPAHTCSFAHMLYIAYAFDLVNGIGKNESLPILHNFTLWTRPHWNTENGFRLIDFDRLIELYFLIKVVPLGMLAAKRDSASSALLMLLLLLLLLLFNVEIVQPHFPLSTEYGDVFFGCG